VASARHGPPRATCFRVTRDGREEIVVLGRLDRTNRRAFLRIVQALVDRGVRSVVVDLGGAEVDRSGIGGLAVAQFRLQRRRGEIVLKAPRSSTLRLLTEARLIDRFPVC
jgi:anti-anti-sigma regulatory factor